MIQYMWLQGERGLVGLPGIQGETGIGLPGPKVNGVMDYIFMVCDCLFATCIFLSLSLLNIFTINFAGWHGIPGPTWPSWSSWSGWTWPTCKKKLSLHVSDYIFHDFYICFISSTVICRENTSTQVFFLWVYRDLKDHQVFKEIKDHKAKGFLG